MIIINDELLDKGKVVLDDGYAFGRAVFETILVKKKPVFLPEHLERLNSSLKKIGVNQYITEEAVSQNIAKLACENCGVKIIVSDKNIVYIKREMNYKEVQYINGFSMILSESRRNKYSNLTYIKSVNYMENILERERAINLGYEECLFLNTDGEVCEGSISNVFLVRNNKIYTPSVQCGLLKGIVREWILNRYHVEEGKYTLEDLYNSDGIFITNSLMGIMGISKINSHIVPKADIINIIRGNYNEYINSEQFTVSS